MNCFLGFRVAKQVNGALTAQYLYAPDGTLLTTLGPDGKLIRGVQYGGGEHLADYTAARAVAGGRPIFSKGNRLLHGTEQRGSRL